VCFFFYRLFLELLEPLLACVCGQIQTPLTPFSISRSSNIIYCPFRLWRIGSFTCLSLSSSSFLLRIQLETPSHLSNSDRTVFLWYSSERQLRGDLNISRVPNSKLE